MNIVCVGEMLIDFVCTDTGLGLINGRNYIKKPGGAPANVAACIGKLGGNVSLVAAVGNDHFGQYLINEAIDHHVNIDNVAVIPLSTTLAFVSLDENGNRDFAFNRGADEHLGLSEKVIETLTTDCILHLGSATALLGGDLADSYYKIAQAAKQKGNIICFDPNFRVDLWKGREVTFTEACQPYISMADIIKVSDEELLLFSQQQDMFKGCKYFHDLGAKIVLVTLGGDGCLISQNGKQTIVPAYRINVIDTTGAGDSFIAAILFRLAQSSPHADFYENQLLEFITFAAKVSALVCSKIGAMSALPTLTEVEGMTFTINK